MTSQVAVIGAGYVGLTTAACLSHLGNVVRCADVLSDKVEALNRGELPILETGLEELVTEGRRSGDLRFVVGAAGAVPGAEFVYLCVPTPQGTDGSADLGYIEAAAREIGPMLEPEAVVINKSTVPVGSTRVVERALGRGDVSVVSNPEFLREGSAVHDFLHPDRVVIGADDQGAAIRVAGLYLGLAAPLQVTDPASAETIKYASNAFLATKISYVNAIAAVCEAVGADVGDVVLGMGYDKRIGESFLRPGPGWGGSCFGGGETVLVRRGTEVWLTRLDQLFADVEARGTAGWEVLAWRDGEPTTEFTGIAAFTSRAHTGEVIDVRTRMGRRLTVTPDHPFVVGDGTVDGVQGTKIANDLTSDDWLPVAQGAPLGPECPAAVPVGAGPDHVTLDAELWHLIGLYLAVGHVAPDGPQRRVTWSFDPSGEPQLVNAVAGYWRRHEVTVAVRRSTRAMTVSVSSRLPASLFTQALGLGSSAADKRLPNRVWTASDTDKRAVLRGLWDGDGSWSLVNGGPNVVFEYGTASRELADGMLRLLGDLGIVARLKVGRTAGSTTDTYRLVISVEELEAASWLVPEEDRIRIRAHASRAAQRTAPTGYRRLSKNAAWVRVASTRRRDFDGTVYSLEVPGAHTVVSTGGIVAHNCFPKDSQALVHIADEAGYDFGLLKGVIAVNDEQFTRVADKIERQAGGSLENTLVAVWGLTFKARTDDLRDSPSLEIISRLLARGARVRAYDPSVDVDHGDEPRLAGIEVSGDPYAACEGAEVLAVLTEWDEFKWKDFDKVAAVMAAPRVVDARNLLDRATLARRNFAFEGIGRV